MDKILLSDMLTQLRQELVRAQGEGKESDLRFLIEDVELELQMVTTEADGAGGGVKFWVFNADAKLEVSEASTQKLTLTLKVVGPDGKSPLPIADEGTRPR